MRKKYTEPECELFKFRFGTTMEGGDDPGLENLRPSDPQSKAEGYGEGLD